MERTITLLQEVLARLGYLTAAHERNVLDAVTRAALRRFQQIHELDPTGEPDDHAWEHLLAADESGECVIAGLVEDEEGRPVARAVVVVQDRDLGDRPNWPRLGAEPTRPDGSFRITYFIPQVLPGDRSVEGRGAVADLVFDLAELPAPAKGFAVHRLPDDERVSDDERALGIQARRFEEVRIVVGGFERRWAEGESEYERALASFRAVWPETSPAALDDTRREPEFVARELDLPREQIDALVGSFRMSERAFDGSVPPEILYGLTRCDQRLSDLPRLALARSAQLKAGISQAVERITIPPQSDEVIDISVRQIRELAPRHALSEDAERGGTNYGAVLRDALPDAERQAALLRTAAGREDDPAAIWDALRANPLFAEPGTIERAQFALQLDALTDRHLPLMAALQSERGITSTRALLDLGRDELRAIIVRPDVGAPDGTPGEQHEERAEAYVTGLIGRLEQAFPTETIARSLAGAPAEAVGGADTQAAVASVLAQATSDEMRARGAAFDIRATHVSTFLAEHGDAVFAGVAEQTRPLVAQQIKRAQRLYRVSTGRESFEWLVRHNYNSAFDIGQVPQQTFMAEAQEALGESQARMMHARAVETSTGTLAAHVQLNDAVSGIYPSAMMLGGDRGVEIEGIRNEVARHFPNWSELFGSVTWCDCPHCRSVYSPAAYLVDLLNFLDKSQRNAKGENPLDVLLKQRPDIAQLKLTCENTNTQIPYVDLVNEVLESLVVAPDPLKIPAFDTGGATSQELQAAPQHTNWDAYVTTEQPGARPRLDRAVYPPSLPFDAPLTAARTYLEHLGVTRADLIEAFSGATTANALAAERLRLSPHAFAVITRARLDGGPTDLPASLDDRFGWNLTPPAALALGAAGPLVWALKRKLNAAGAALAVGPAPAAETFDADTQAAVQNFQIEREILPATGDVDAKTWAALLSLEPSVAAAFLPHAPTFLERSGLSYAELLSLLRMRFVNPEQQTFDITRRLKLPDDKLIEFVEADLQNPDEALVDALTAAGVTQEDFDGWAQEHLSAAAWARLKRTILADAPAGETCDLSKVTIRHWDPESPTLTDEEWLKLDRLTRLRRALGWEIDELDLALVSLGATDIDAAVFRQLAQVRELARRIDLSIPQVVSLWADLDPTRPGSLYERRFRNRALLRVDPAFEPDWAGRVLGGATVAGHVAALQAGLRVSGADLAHLSEHLDLEDESAALSLENLSAMFRRVTLARALQLNVRDLTRMLDLTGLDPFTAPGDDWQASAFVSAVRRLQETGLNAAQLEYILSEVKATDADEAQDRALDGLRDGLRAIAAELDPSSETEGSLTRRALSLLQLDPQLTEDLLRIALGTDQHTAALPPTPAPPQPPLIPQGWAERLRYSSLKREDQAAHERTLVCRGALTDGERDTVKAFSLDAEYKKAVDALHAAPRRTIEVIASELAKSGVRFPAAAALLSNTLAVADAGEREKRVRARLTLILDAVLPPLREELSRTLVKQTVTALPLEAKAAAILLEGERAEPGGGPDGRRPMLPASDPAQPLIADLLDLATSNDMTKAREAFGLLTRLRLLAEALPLKTEDLEVVARHLVALRSDPRRLMTFADWESVAAYARVRTRAGQRDGLLARLWQETTVDGAHRLLSGLLGWPEQTIADLMGEVKGADGGALDLEGVKQPANLARLIAAGELVRTLGVPATQAARWARGSVGRGAADEARRAVKAKYDEAAWLEAAKPLSDALREARRLALVAYLLPRLKVRDADGLYQQLLIDVEMSPCMMTSRVKQAISSVQLFVQRCQLNLVKEGDQVAVSPQAIDAGHWKWMQNYRVWEANRKVLLYPENWTLPELRDDKTPFFKELESALLQDDVTDANVERALFDYLGKLDKVAKLDIVALHVQEQFEPREKLQTVVHVFGRTPNPPHAYYYRRYEVTANGTALWTPWEVVPVDVQGTIIAPVVFNRRLYIFWALVTTKTKEPPVAVKEPQPPAYYQEIQLAWSEYRHGAWSPKQVSEADQVLRVDYTPPERIVPPFYNRLSGPGVIDRLEPWVMPLGGSLVIDCVARRYIFWPKKEDASYPVPGGGDSRGDLGMGSDVIADYVGSFEMGECNGRLSVHAAISRSRHKSGFVFGVSYGGKLQRKQIAGGKPLPADTVLAMTGGQITEYEWVHDGPGYMAFADAGQVYFVRFFPVGLHDAAAEIPGLVSPHLGALTKGASVAESSPLKEAARLKGVSVAAEARLNSWASASASLAAVGAGAALDKLDIAIQAAKWEQAVGSQFAKQQPKRLGVSFETLFHPFACTYIKRLQQYGVGGVLTPENQHLTLRPSFAARHQPSPGVTRPLPTDGVDFGETEKPGIYRTSAYSVYNWELFFHIPVFVADRLSQNQRFEEAMRWLHYVFNPTDGRGGYWKFKPFAKTPKQTVEDWLRELNAGNPELRRQVAEWKDHPFEPHRVARMRLPSYQKFVVMRYLDNLIAWGDKLFERDTIESINQATQLYVMAADLLGPRPERIPPTGEPEAMTFAEMRGKLDALSNVAAEFENAFPTLSSATLAGDGQTAGLLGVSRTLYFCLPPNEKLLGYWDTVADRLFKIRHCMNLAGVVRQLPLFEPPIDPALLVRAAAQGIDLGSVLSDLNAPTPHYRFPYVLQKALEACAELKSLGAALLSALEKKDAEALAAMRATHETAALRETLDTRKRQEDEAAAQVEALMRSRDVPLERLRHFRKLMGIEGETPQVGEEIPMAAYAPQLSDAGGVFLTNEEVNELAASRSARDWRVRSTFTEVLAHLAHYTPSFGTVTAPWGTGVKIEFGGQHVGPALSAVSRYQAGLGFRDEYDASRAGKMAAYHRRHHDFAFQANVAAREIMSIDRQITAATIRREIAALERRNMEQQIERTESVEQYLKTKYTNADLYGWMQGQVTSLYFQTYQLTYEAARQAERCFRFELGLTSSGYVKFGAWDSLRKGLLAGERLHLQLKQLERAYHEQQRRTLEITKHVSLLQHAPLALIRLKETGQCEFDLPELLFDMDYPGHYMRRIKSVSLTVPAVVGPYASVNATLTMLANETRVSSALAGGRYERNPDGDDRFVDDFAAVQAIATSGGQNDGGMFELNFRDDRYLPFEGAGAATRWRVEIDPDCNRFDLGAVSDVVLHVKYTAHDGGQRLRQKAKDYWKKLVSDQEGLTLSRLFSLKHEFPTEWHRLRTVAEANGDHVQTIALTRDRFPILFRGSQMTVGTIDLFGVPKAGARPTKLPALTTPKPTPAVVELADAPPIGPLLHRTGAVQVRVKDDEEQAAWRLSVAGADVAESLERLDDILILCHYSTKAPQG